VLVGTPNYGTIASSLLNWTASALAKDPTLAKFDGWTSQDSVDTPPSSSCHLKILGIDPTKMAVAPRGVVKRFNVGRDVRLRQLSIPVNLLLDAFLFQAAEE
jgi:hypothetical protein